MKEKNEALIKWIRIIFFLVGFGLLAGGIFGLYRFQKISEEYVRTTAKIESIEKKYDRRAGKKKVHYYVTASYEGGGKKYKEKLNFYSSMMRVGEDINILYNPKDPLQVRSADFEPFLYLALFISGITLWVSCIIIPRFLSRKILQS